MATYDNIIWRMCVACRLHAYACTHTLPRTHKHACTHTRAHTHKYIIFITFHGNSGFVNAPQRYVIRTLPVVSILATSTFQCTHSLLRQFVAHVNLLLLSKAHSCKTPVSVTYDFRDRLLSSEMWHRVTFLFSETSVSIYKSRQQTFDRHCISLNSLNTEQCANKSFGC